MEQQSTTVPKYGGVPEPPPHIPADLVLPDHTLKMLPSGIRNCYMEWEHILYLTGEEIAKHVGNDVTCEKLRDMKTMLEEPGNAVTVQGQDYILAARAAFIDPKFMQRHMKKCGLSKDVETFYEDVFVKLERMILHRQLFDQDFECYKMEARAHEGMRWRIAELKSDESAQELLNAQTAVLKQIRYKTGDDPDDLAFKQEPLHVDSPDCFQVAEREMIRDYINGQEDWEMKNRSGLMRNPHVDENHRRVLLLVGDDLEPSCEQYNEILATFDEFIVLSEREWIGELQTRNQQQG